MSLVSVFVAGLPRLPPKSAEVCPTISTCLHCAEAERSKKKKKNLGKKIRVELMMVSTNFDHCQVSKNPIKLIGSVR
jgi:hypothetical protein